MQLSGPGVEIVDLGRKGLLIKDLPCKRDPWELFAEGIAELGGTWPERTQEKDQTRSEW